MRSPPDTATFEAEVDTLFIVPPPNQVEAQFEVFKLVPLNSSSKTGVPQPLAPVVALPRQGATTPLLVQPSVAIGVLVGEGVAVGLGVAVGVAVGFGVPVGVGVDVGAV
jgi:hypothetical protein